jgi:hypothetical protein
MSTLSNEPNLLVQIIVEKGHKPTQEVGVLVRDRQIAGDLSYFADNSVPVVGGNARVGKSLGGSQ